MAAQGRGGAIEWLREGNSRFVERVKGQEARRRELEAGQSPRVALLGCADSRVAPEIVFDSGPGEIFVVRVAGNVANASSIASIEYAVAHLGVRLVVVVAHQSCGAVAAAIEGGDAGNNLEHLLQHIQPAVGEAGSDEVDAVARRSARLNAERLVSESEILSKAVAADGLQIVTAFFDFSKGVVEFDLPG
jgi:carbonic anhydrase